MIKTVTVEASRRVLLKSASLFGNHVFDILYSSTNVYGVVIVLSNNLKFLQSFRVPSRSGKAALFDTRGIEALICFAVIASATPARTASVCNDRIAAGRIPIHLMMETEKECGRRQETLGDWHSGCRAFIQCFTP